MKIKKFTKTILTLISFSTCFTLVPKLSFLDFYSKNDTVNLLNNNSDNFLNIATPSNELDKMKNFDFSYDKSKNNILYISDNKNEIANKIALSMFKNYDFFYDDAIYTVDNTIKQEYDKIGSEKGLVYYELKENQNNPQLSFFYFFKYENSMLGSAGIKVVEVPILKYLKWNNIGDDQYTISFTIPYTWVTGPRLTLDRLKQNNKLIDVYYMDKYKDQFITIGFENIIFRNISNSISYFSYVDIDPMELTYNSLKSLFKLHNSLEPTSLSYTVEEHDSYYQVNAKKITYEIKDKQNFNIYYEGNYSIVFTKGNYKFNWDVIKSIHNLITLTSQDLWDELVINQNYKNMISNISLDKDYLTNSITINVNFDKSKYQNLTLYSFMEEYFQQQTFNFKLDTDSTVNFYLEDKHKNILFKNFNIEYLKAKFNLLPYELKINNIDEISNDNDTNTISFTAYLSISINGVNYDFSVSNTYSDFESYSILDIEKITNFFDNNFYDDRNNLEIENIHKAFSNQTNWTYLVNHSKNLIFQNLKINLLSNENKFELSFDVYNNNNLYLDSSTISIDLKQKIIEDDNNNELKPETPIISNQENKKTSNLKYLWLLTIIIPIIVLIIFKYFKKKK